MLNFKCFKIGCKHDSHFLWPRTLLILTFIKHQWSMFQVVMFQLLISFSHQERNSLVGLQPSNQRNIVKMTNLTWCSILSICGGLNKRLNTRPSIYSLKFINLIFWSPGEASLLSDKAQWRGNFECFPQCMVSSPLKIMESRFLRMRPVVNGSKISNFQLGV